MPTVLSEKGYRFFFFSNEGNPLEPCHIHVRKNGSLAKFWVENKCTLAQNYEFTTSELNEISKIIDSNINTIKGGMEWIFH